MAGLNTAIAVVLFLFASLSDLIFLPEPIRFCKVQQVQQLSKNENTEEQANAAYRQQKGFYAD